MLETAGERGEQLVEPHDVACLGEPSCRQGRAQQLQAAFALWRCQILEHHAVTKEVRVYVDPLPAFTGIQWETHRGSIERIERFQEGERRFAQRRRVHDPSPDAEESGHDLAVGGDAAQRRLQLSSVPGHDGIDHLLERRHTDGSRSRR